VRYSHQIADGIDELSIDRDDDFRVVPERELGRFRTL
jgi:hypothetical protein